MMTFKSLNSCFIVKCIRACTAPITFRVRSRMANVVPTGALELMSLTLMSPLAAGTGPAVPYIIVYAIEIALLAATLLAMLPLFGIRPSDAVTAIAKATPLQGGIAGLPDGRRASS